MFFVQIPNECSGNISLSFYKSDIVRGGLVYIMWMLFSSFPSFFTPTGFLEGYGSFPRGPQEFEEIEFEFEYRISFRKQDFFKIIYSPEYLVVTESQALLTPAFLATPSPPPILYEAPALGFRLPLEGWRTPAIEMAGKTRSRLSVIIVI